MKRTIFILQFVIRCSQTMEAAPFQNLSFDEANTNNVEFFIPAQGGRPPEGVGASIDFLPAWQLFPINSSEREVVGTIWII